MSAFTWRDVSPPPFSRRSVLKLTGALAVSGLAGCLGQPKYDRDALDEALATSLPIVGPPSLPLRNGYRSAARETAQEQASRLDSRLSNLPDGLDAEDRAVYSARDNLSDARGLLAGQFPQTSELDAIRYARELLGEGHGWLDAATGARTEADLRERIEAFRPVVSDQRGEVEYRATTIPTGIVVAGATEDRLWHASTYLEQAAERVDTASENGADSRLTHFAQAAGYIAAIRACVADAGAIIDGQQKQIFDNTPSLREPMERAAATLLETLEPEISVLGLLSTDSTVALRAASVLTPNRPRSEYEALGRNEPASSLIDFSPKIHQLHARRAFVREHESIVLPDADSTESVLHARTSAIDALRDALESQPGPLERILLGHAVRELQRGDDRLEDVARETANDKSAATDSAKWAAAEYVAGRYLVEAVKPAALRVVNEVESEV
ncbi:hypothetical protein ACFQJC_09040 [Haloferax namakaokahaiae]|uniref:Uncharacterized protein n=1 Tax=Haloferax namakaokahaiae TaxID=1748331 RepID=A0ABD5ZEX4_9EURY